ncbi:MAG: hypothetical protein ABL882_00525 [Sphingopyxis sp.]
MGNITTSLQRLDAAIDRLDTAVAGIPARARPTSPAPGSQDKLRAEVAATIAELDQLIGQHRG